MNVLLTPDYLVHWCLLFCLLALTAAASHEVSQNRRNCVAPSIMSLVQLSYIRFKHRLTSSTFQKGRSCVEFYSLGYHVSGKNIIDQEEGDQLNRDKLLWAATRILFYDDWRTLQHLQAYIVIAEHGHVLEYELTWNGAEKYRVNRTKTRLRVQADQGAISAPPHRVYCWL